MATGLWSFSLARFMDRVSKGIRSAPADALMADLASAENYASTYGLRHSFCTAGAILGALAALLWGYLYGVQYRWLFPLSCIPALFSLALLCSMPSDLFPKRESRARRTVFSWKLLSSFPGNFWLLLLVTSFLMLARFSEAFLALRAKSLGWSSFTLPGVIVITDLVQALVAYPLGRMADVPSKRRKLFLMGLVALVASHLSLGCARSSWMLLLGILLAGAHLGSTQGLLKALLVEASPPELYGTAFAAFHLSSGCAGLLGNLLAGKLADLLGIQAAFLGGALFAFFSLLIFMAMLSGFWRRGGASVEAPRRA